MSEQKSLTEAQREPSLPVLVVDLDGTLIRTDLLHETFWAALARGSVNPARLLVEFFKGRAALKAYLAQATTVDVARLPYNPDVCREIREWRAKGGHCALVTASDGTLARRIADHLGLFDEVHGSDGRDNLKAGRKAAFLRSRFGDRGFIYIGDSAADLSVWAEAAGAVTVTASPGLRRRVEALVQQRGAENGATAPVRHLPAERVSLATHLRAMRPHQWVKNILIFLPMLAAQQFDIQTLGHTLLAFAAFCLVASGIYLLNDLLDLEGDRAHPRKRERPLASGELPLARGSLLFAVLVLCGIAIAMVVGAIFVGVLLVYLVTTMLYSLDLKRRLIVDICILTGLYTVRILAGGAAAGIVPSVWLLAFSIFLFLSLAAVKRQAELIDGRTRGSRKALGRGYHVDDIPVISMIAMSAGMVSVLVMALYLNSPDVRSLYSTPEALWGICPVLLYWISRIVLLTHRGWMHDDPIVFAARDPNSWYVGGAVLGFIILASVF